MFLFSNFHLKEYILDNFELKPVRVFDTARKQGSKTKTSVQVTNFHKIQDSIKEEDEENCPEDILEVIKPQKVKKFDGLNKNNLKIKQRSNSVVYREFLPHLSASLSSENAEGLQINTHHQKLVDHIEENKSDEISEEEPEYSEGRVSIVSPREVSIAKSARSQTPALNISEEVKRISEKHKRECGCPSILIVDDQFINRLILKEFCAQLDLHCIEAEDGKVAVNTMVNYKKQPCCDGILLILMDLNMPRMDGIQATKEILHYKQEGIVHKDLEIVAVTAFASEEEKRKCEQAGMVDFIRKPVSILNLINLVKE
jgi:CheY-like chemotaxis protein